MDKKYLFAVIILLIMMVVTVLIYQSQGLKRIYKSEVQKGIARLDKSSNTILTQDDIKHLPKPVQKYLDYAGVIGKVKVQSFRAVVDGEMKLDPKKDFVKINFEQYNFFDSQLTRLFYLEAKMSGLPVSGLHSYTADRANMLIKAAGLITVLNTSGQEMRISDTTTLFNDMCFFAPATLIDERVKWETIDDLSVKATFTNNGCSISAVLFFNKKGELINFVSNDRYYIPMDGSSKRAQWSTPISYYKEMNGLKLPTNGEAVWNLPEGDYCYARNISLKEIEYNLKSFK
ncbi:MAG: hypothetical protein K0R31_1940 [Clostridiales bacterium]|nr:hypothetical protein [Clostridiales bacterium]